MKATAITLALLGAALLHTGSAAGQSPAPGQARDYDAIERAIAGGRLKQARLMLSNLGTEAAKGPRFDLLLGQYYLAQNQPVLALERFERALAEEPGSPALTGAGIASLRLGQTARAQSYLKAAVASHPRNAQAWNALGVTEDRLRDWNAAETAYAKALEIRPRDPLVLNNLAYSLILRRHFQDALLLLRHAVNAAPEERMIQDNYALALALTGEYPSEPGPSLSDDERARRLNNAGYAAWLKGDAAAARALLARAIEAKPSRYELAERNLAMVEKELGQ